MLPLGPYQFRKIIKADLPLLKSWLDTPIVRQWWGDPSDEVGVMRRDVNDSKIVMQVVLHEGEPFAFVQDYRVHDWPHKDYDQYYKVLPKTTRGVDTFIGREDFYGKGHGSAYLTLYIAHLLAGGAEQIVIDPNARNERAIRAYEKAGFSKWKEIVADGINTQLMLFGT